MKYLGCIVTLLFLGINVTAQDFSYLKSIDLSDSSQKIEAQEAAMECCCYLVGVRYDKKDEQRGLATAFVNEWMKANINEKDIMEGVEKITAEVDGYNDMYLAFYIMNYIDNDGELSLMENKVEAVKGLLSYCGNSSNKLKVSKELKQVDQLSQAGELEQYLTDAALTSSKE